MVEWKISVRCCMSSGIEHNIKSMKGLRISVKKKKRKKKLCCQVERSKITSVRLKPNIWSVSPPSERKQELYVVYMGRGEAMSLVEGKN